jgi:IS30 family transposase
MNKHLSFTDRVILQNFIELSPRCSAIETAAVLNKSRSTVYYELKNFTTHFTSSSVYYNGGSVYQCPHLKKFPFCCNGCAKTRCSHRSSEYDAYKAQDKATRLLVNSRVDTTRRRNTIDLLNKTVSQLIRDGLSIKVAILSVNRCDVSESTIRRYINNGLLLATRMDLPNAVRFKVKKEYNYSRKRINIKLLYKRTYQDYLDYMKTHPKAKVIQVDSVIGKSNDKTALLTVFFLNSKFQLAVKYNRKNSSVSGILLKLYLTAL